MHASRRSLLSALVAAAGAVTLIAPVLPVTAAPIDKSENLTPIGQIQYTGGTELAARGKFLYAGELNGEDDRDQKPNKGGIHIYKLASSGKPREVGFLHCPGNDNDVEALTKWLIVVAYHNNRCGNPGDDGMLVVNIRNKRKPRVVGNVDMPAGGAGSAHTLTPYPGRRIVYINPGGLANGNSVEQIVRVGRRGKPKVPKIVASYGPADGGPASGCHDLSFHFNKERKLAFCAGKGHVTIWNVEDPFKPEFVSTIENPAIEFDHFAVASSDGKLLAIDDEAFAIHECRTGQSGTGRVWIYDISNPTVPVLQSSFAPPRGGDETGVGHYTGWIPSWCLSHGLSWKPGTHDLAVTWFTGGFSVLRLDNPTAPEEIAHYMAEDSATYSALWHNGTLYTNDTYRGTEAFKISL